MTLISVIIIFKTSEPKFADVPFALIFRLPKNGNNGIFPRSIKRTDFDLPIQSVFVDFPSTLQQAKKFLEQPLVVSSVFDETHII